MEVSICLLLPIQMKNATNSGVRARLHPLEMQYRGAVERFTQHFPLTISTLKTFQVTPGHETQHTIKNKKLNLASDFSVCVDRSI